MGLFDFFRKKEKQNNSLPPAFQKAIAILFPNGNDDRLRQLKELNKHFGSKYELDYINNNLIFILSGYLITGNIKTKEKAVASVLNRVDNKMSSTDVEYLHDYALENHPKLSILKVVESLSNALENEECETDTMPGGYGSFGYSPTNPIPTKGVLGIYDYLSRLYDTNQQKVDYTRIGTITNEISSHPIDEFKISSAKGVDTLYFSGHQNRTSRLSPYGYTLFDEYGQVLPTASDEDFPVKKEPIESNPIPQLLGLLSFGCLSSDKLIGKDCVFIEAEKCNKKGIVLSNQGKADDFLDENGLDFLHNAITLQSLNAVNNNFAVLSTLERYHEAYRFLESIVDTPDVTLRGLYNLAVLYYKADYYAEYEVSKDITKAYTLLVQAVNLPKDDREENREYTREKAKELMSQLEKEDNSLLQKKDEIICTFHNKMAKFPTKIDICSKNLADRLSDVYHCIKSAAEKVLSEMAVFAFPELSERSKLEIELMTAGILSHYIDKNIVLQSLLAKNSQSKNFEMATLMSRIDSYRIGYEQQILCTDISKRVPLIEFNKTNGGALKLWHRNTPDSSGNTKAPIFDMGDSKQIVCRFVFFDKEEQTAEFIIKNKNNIFVDITTSGEHLFQLKREIKWFINHFVKICTWNIFFSGIKFDSACWGDDIDRDLKTIKRDSLKVNILPADVSQEPDFDRADNIVIIMRYIILEEGVNDLMREAINVNLIDKDDRLNQMGIL